MDTIEWIPGENCDVILSHPKHEKLPLVLLRRETDSNGARVRIHYEVYWPDAQDWSVQPTEVRHLFFTVLAAEEMLSPDSGFFPFTRSEIKGRLNDILLEKTNLSLQTASSLITGLYSDQHAVINTIYPCADTVEIHLTTRNPRDIVSGENSSIWVTDDSTTSSVWGQAIWN